MGVEGLGIGNPFHADVANFKIADIETVEKVGTEAGHYPLLLGRQHLRRAILFRQRAQRRGEWTCLDVRPGDASEGDLDIFLLCDETAAVEREAFVEKAFRLVGIATARCRDTSGQNKIDIMRGERTEI